MNEQKPTTKRENNINRHFKREGKWMVYLFIALPIVLTIIAAIVGPVVLNALQR